MNDLEILNLKFAQLTKLSLKNQKSLMNWFNKQNLIIKMEVFKELRNQFFKLQSIDSIQNRDFISLSAFYVAVQEIYNLDKLVVSKNKSSNLQAIAKISSISIHKYRKSKIKVKKEKLLNMWSIIKKLKNEAYSFRDISIFLQQRHRLNVSHTYIRNVWEEIEND